MNDADGRGESQAERAFADGERVLRIADAAADHGVDVHVKVGVGGQVLELLVEDFEAFLGNVVGGDVIDGNLQPFEAGAVQALDALGDKKIAVGDEARNHAVLANAADDVVEFGMQQRLAAADGHGGGAEARPACRFCLNISSRATGLETSSNSLQ